MTKHCPLAPCETAKTITTEVKGDGKRKTTRRSIWNLFGNTDTSVFTKNRGLGTIQNDD